jgi:hypothetical protein
MYATGACEAQDSVSRTWWPGGPGGNKYEYNQENSPFYPQVAVPEEKLL